MKAILSIIIWSVFISTSAAQIPKDTVYTTFKSKKAAYIKINMAATCPLDDLYNKPCKLQVKEIKKQYLGRMNKLFKYLNYMYKHKIREINKVSPEFLAELDEGIKMPGDTTERTDYAIKNDNISIFMYVTKGKIRFIEVFVVPPTIDCCNSKGEGMGLSMGYFDYRIFDYLDIKIPLLEWEHHNDYPTFRWDYFDE